MFSDTTRQYFKLMYLTRGGEYLLESLSASVSVLPSLHADYTPMHPVSAMANVGELSKSVI